MNAAPEPPDRIELAREPDFRIGALLVRPSSCRIEFAGGQERVEPRVMEVLVALARAPGRTVSRDQLVDLCWDGRIVSDAAINRVVAKARQVARRIEPPPFSIETVPKVGFRLTPASLSEADDSADAARARDGDPALAFLRTWRARLGARGLAGTGLAILVAAAAIAGTALFGEGSLWRAPSRPVEVTLFEPEQPEDRELRGLSTALGQAVVRVLTSSGVRTAPWPISADARSSAADAEFRVAGTLRRTAEAFVVNAQILEQASGTVLWSTQLERPIDIAVGLDEQAANDIGGALYCALGEREAAGGRMKAEVLSLFLNACAAAIQIQNPERMLSVTRRLIAAAPNVAGAHAMHALALTRTATGMRNAPDDAARLIEDARDSARRALRLNPREAKAYVALSNTYLFAPNAPNWVEMERNLKRALEIDPELTQARLGYAWTLLEVGRTRAALDAFSGLTRAADPRARSNLLLVAAIQAQLGDRGAADAMIDRLARIYPEEARNAEWGITIWWEDVGVARSGLRTLARGSAPLEQQVVCFDKYLSGLAARRNAAIRGLPSECSVVSPDWRFRMLARQGDVDAAYALFETRRREFIISQLTKILFFPEMREFRRDLRFMSLAKKMGLVDYWLAADKWPDFCSEPDLPYDCRAAARAS